MSIEENNENLKNDIKNDILEVKENITRDFKEQTEEMRKHMNKLKDENEDLRNRSMQLTFIFLGLPENEESNAWEDVPPHLVSLLSSRLNLNYDELDLELSRAHRTPKTTGVNDNRPIFATFVNWPHAGDIRKRMMRLHAERKSKITVSQMFSKELAQRQKIKLLKKEKKYFRSHLNSTSSWNPQHVWWQRRKTVETSIKKLKNSKQFPVSSPGILQTSIYFTF